MFAPHVGSILVFIIVVVVCSPILAEEEKFRFDPNYTQEFVRIRDVGLRALIVMDGHAVKCELLQSVTSSIKLLNASKIQIVHKGIHTKDALPSDCSKPIESLTRISHSSVSTNTYELIVSLSTFSIPSHAIITSKNAKDCYKLHVYAPQDDNSEKKYDARKPSRNITAFSGYDMMMLYHDIDQTDIKTETLKDISQYNNLSPSLSKLPIDFTEISSTTIEDEFIDHLHSILMSGILSKPFTNFVQWNLPSLRGKSIVVNEAKIDFNIALIIEPREHPHLEFVVRNVLLHLNSGKGTSNWKLQIHVSSLNEEFAKKILVDIPNVDYKLLPSKFSSSGDYNTLLKEKQLWKDIQDKGAKSVLVFQVDTLLIENDISPFLIFDYIGAPWHVTPNTPSSDWIRDDYVLSTQGKGAYYYACCNGGLSLRNVEKMVKITESRRSRNPQVNEDTFYSRSAKDLNMKIPKRYESYSFAWEIPCNDIEQQNDTTRIPFGLHNAWVYFDLHEVWMLFEESMKSLDIPIVRE
jgi:hypothetical protein